jgi:alpha-amylase/alpha-mannosidase (GH57 family)
MPTYIVVHGHFYQPPRENPWTGMMEREHSAHPFHDWNERIHAECYRPNAWARIVDGYARVERIVNNYAAINFNFGPTLLNWMVEHAPATYQRVLEADRLSQARFGGHGSAIAQAYNHSILPLCNERDRVTQIRWGLADFHSRFGRPAEALWVPETACNDAVLGALIDAELKYVILSPYQAERVRPLNAHEWSNVADGNVDTGRAYKYYHRDGSGRSIALFFYDGPISRAIAFEGALYSSQVLLDRFAKNARGGGRLISVATDGETYGHHTHFGDRTLAYALEIEARQRGFIVTNYGQFLEEHPPEWEAEIKPGPNGEGTSWSCAHGVGRWYRDCGDSTGAGEGWNQAWRTPLRQALDHLRDAAIIPVEESRGRLYADPWAARDAYIGVVLSGGATRQDFLRRHAQQGLKEEDQVHALTLMELQRHAMTMYTSCGWFFADISGLESVQVLKYAGRVMDHLAELGLPSPRERFLEILAEAKSNIPAKGNGADIFRREVDPLRMTPQRFAAHFAICGLLDSEGESQEGSLGGFHFSRRDMRKESRGRITMATGRVHLEAAATGRAQEFMHAALYIGGVDFYCVLRPYSGPRRFKAAVERLWEQFATGSLLTLLRVSQDEFGPEEYDLRHVLPRGRQRILEHVFADLINRFDEQYSRLYEDNRGVIEQLREAGFRLPPELAAAAEFALGWRLEQEVRSQRRSQDPQAYRRAREIVEEAHRGEFNIQRESVRRTFEEMILESVRRVAQQPDTDAIAAALALVQLSRDLRMTPDLTHAQEAIYPILVAPRQPPTPELVALATAIGLSPRLIQPAG